jgi:hypothetical protein
MAYGLKYECEFDSLDGEEYTIQFYLKDYVGDSTAVLGGASPVLLSWSAEDPLTPIRGASLDITLINENGSLPLNTFFSTADDQWKIILLEGIATKFVGFLVQDDCTEVMVDYNHEIKLTATDGLGILKERKAELTYTEKRPLTYLFAHLLTATNLELDLNVFSRLLPVGGVEARFLDDVWMEDITWLNNSEWDDCYSILEKILKRFRFTLFQADGIWNMIRFDELRQYSGEILGAKYGLVGIFGSQIYAFDTGVTMPEEFDIGPDELSFPETGLTESIVRPCKFVKEKFSYRQPYDILRNSNFERVGNLITSYADGSDTLYEYEMTDWQIGKGYNVAGTLLVDSSATRFIRVRKNSFGEEIDRIGVIKGAAGHDDRTCAECYKIEVSAGDRIRFSFDYKTLHSQVGNRYFLMEILTTSPAIPRSLNNRNLETDGTWTYNGSILSAAFTPENHNEWKSVSVETDIIPVTGLLYFNLAQQDGSAADSETHYKNIRFEIFRSIGINVIGHTHTDTQDENINNDVETDIACDSSPSNSIAGTLFVKGFTNGVRDRAISFKRGDTVIELRLGEITTFDQLFQRRIPRRKLEGTFYNVTQKDSLSPLTLVNYTSFAGDWFIWGNMEIDYRNRNVKGTLWEWYKDTEADGDLTEIYDFKYLYDK